MVAFDSANIEIQKDYQKERFVILEVLILSSSLRGSTKGARELTRSPFPLLRLERGVIIMAKS